MHPTVDPATFFLDHASNGRPSNILLASAAQSGSEMNRSAAGSLRTYSSWMFMPVCRHHFFKIQVYVLVDTDRRSSAFKRPPDIVLRWSDLTNPRADFFLFLLFFFFFFLPARGGGGVQVSPSNVPDPLHGPLVVRCR